MLACESNICTTSTSCTHLCPEQVGWEKQNKKYVMTNPHYAHTFEIHVAKTQQTTQCKLETTKTMMKLINHGHVHF